MNRDLLRIGVALCFGALCLSSCSDDDKEESNTKNEENAENSMNSVGLSGTSSLQQTYNLSKGDAQMVDLGLPSGTKWADRNIGATSLEDYGAYFAWGETKPKDYYDWSTYLDGNIWLSEDCGTDDDVMKDLTDIAGNATYDAATVNWGAGYKMPTKEQWSELNNSSYTTWTWCNGRDIQYNNTSVKGYKVTSKANSNSIFLPVAGYYSGMFIYMAGSDGYYWSSSLFKSRPYYVNTMRFYSHDQNENIVEFRFKGQSVRAVGE